MGINRPPSRGLIAIGTILASLTGCGPADQPLAQKNASNPMNDAVHEIPLSSVYSTNGQECLKVVSRGLENPYGPDLQQIYRDSAGMGASNVFLVRGKDIAAAVKATRRIFIGGRAADAPADPEDGSEATLVWLVAYLGNSGSEPPTWQVESVGQTGKTFRIAYRKGLAKTKDIHKYFVWVPLRKLDTGTYDLELFDAGKGELTLLRRVTVTGR